jgi:hypothetical protein
MSEQPVSALSEGDQDPTQLNHFKAGVVIGELPFVIEGTAPNIPATFDLVVSLPDDKWAELKPRVDEEITKNSQFASRYRRLQQIQCLGNGTVGLVWVSEAIADDGAQSVGVSGIQTNSMYLPEGSEYHNASGIGSFILDSLCTIADIRGWRVYLEPLERGGKLTQGELVEWYKRHGFEDNSSEDKHSNFGGMVRFPGQVDPSQPIARLVV